MKRLFVGIPLSPELKKRAEELENKLKLAGIKGSFVSADNLHLTIKFLGRWNLV